MVSRPAHSASLVAIVIVALMAPATALAQGLEGMWAGTLGSGESGLHLIFGVQRNADGTVTGGVASLERASVNAFDRMTFGDDRTVRMEFDRLHARYEGVLSQDGKEIVGAWIQRERRQALTLTRFAGGTITFRPWSPEVEAIVTAPPTAVKIDGRMRLFYELHVTNWSNEDITLRRLEIVIGDDTAVLDEPLLQRLSMRRTTRLAPGVRSVLLLSLDNSSAFPDTIRHRLTFTQSSGPDSVTLECARTAVAARAVRISPPVRGEGWLAGNGPDSSPHHRAEIRATDGRLSAAQRFAFDFSRQAAPVAAGSTRDPQDNRQHGSYGADVLAVADGIIVATKDGIPDSVPYDIAPAVPLTRETILGNHIVLDIGGGRFATYAHLQPASIRVRVGDKVARGQVLGVVGNSGRTDAPHLHFHVTDGSDPLASEGVPFVFDEFSHSGTIHRDEMPSGEWRVDFKP